MKTKNASNGFLPNSVVYRLLAGSWLLGWLISTPAETGWYYEHSLVSKVSRKRIDGAAHWSYKIGQPIQAGEKTSLLALNPLGFAGMVLFFYFAFDISLHDYSWQRNLVEIGLAFLAFSLVLARSCPGIWQGTLAYRMIHWWVSRD